MDRTHRVGKPKVSKEDKLGPIIIKFAFYDECRGVVTEWGGGGGGFGDFKHKKGSPLNIFRFLIPKNFKHRKSPPLNIFRFLTPKNLKHKKGPPLNIFRFLIPKNFKHKKIRLESLTYFSIPNTKEIQI